MLYTYGMLQYSSLVSYNDIMTYALQLPQASDYYLLAKDAGNE